MWEIENIPDECTIFRRVPNSKIIDGEVAPDAFLNSKDVEGKKTDSMSTNWEKYADALVTRNAVALDGLNPLEFGVVKMCVADIKQKVLPSQSVDHNPLKHTPDNPRNNRAHTHVNGQKRLPTQELFKSIAELCLAPEILKQK